MQHYAWSPLDYNPVVQGHPLMHPDYQAFVQRVMNHLQEEHYGELYHTHTDFHSNILVNNRGATAYIVVSFDHVISPVFFNLNELQQYVTQFPVHNNIYFIQHHAI